jgi:Acetyltransferase (GNAT) domain
MSGQYIIQYLTHQQIDKQKWDSCIEQSANGLIYGYSFYLDPMAKQWDALVLAKGLHSDNDYVAVMPLTWNKKYGIHYLHQPFLTAQLGIFGNTMNAEMAASFLQSIPPKFKYWDFYLNYQNVFPLKEFELYQRSNFVLALNKPYLEIYNSYKENIQRNIKKAAQAGCTIQKDFEVEKVIELAIQQMKSQGEESADNIDRFRKLYQHLHTRQMATTYGIVSTASELLASCVFFFSHNRAYYILVGNHPDGKTIGASHALIDAFIKDHAGKNMMLDFEGSDIPSLAHFYSSFGAVNEIYAGIKLNRLPFYLKWIKS